ncbi:MAG: hypothetical protein K2X66_14890 [Cyanobacteria bacterium]|nr:hypothetical protein [Cyanobacteriota bacterium]
MFKLFFTFDFWLVALGVVLIVRQLCLILAAEQGRKHDLIKKLYKANLDFHVSILIPFLDSSKLDGLLSLVKSIEDQEYPATKISIQIAATEQTVTDLAPFHFKPNIKIWTFPALKSNTGDVVWWLIERCMASGGAGLLVFLKPNDIIKPDFIQNVAARSFDANVLQGYVAIKHRPSSIIGKVVALSERLTNRIDNAGRYHLGMSCHLMDSGWVIKQEVLEMIPYQRGWDLNNLEYTIRLNLQNFKATWAPNMVIYTDEQSDFIQQLTDSIGTFCNRIALTVVYGYRLLFNAIEEWEYSYFEQFLTIIKPPNFLLGAFLVFMGTLSNAGVNPIPTSATSWTILAVGFFIVQLLSLFVARCRAADYITFFIYTPLVYFAGLVCLPIGIINYISGLIILAGGSKEEKNYRKSVTTRFNEALDPYPSLLESETQLTSIKQDLATLVGMNGSGSLKNKSIHTASSSTSAASITPQPLEQPHPRQSTRAESTRQKKQPSEQSKIVSISNGVKEIECTLKTVIQFNADGDETYQMSLQYKTVAFSTASYRLLDQAFYELHGKLKSHGFTLMTCGTCGYFYNPAADMRGAVKNSGVCLFGKIGKEVNLQTDAVTILSPDCPYHCSIDVREEILKEWRTSLATGATTP